MFANDCVRFFPTHLYTSAVLSSSTQSCYLIDASPPIAVCLAPHALCGGQCLPRWRWRVGDGGGGVGHAP